MNPPAVNPLKSSDSLAGEGVAAKSPLELLSFDRTGACQVWVAACAPNYNDYPFRTGMGIFFAKDHPWNLGQVLDQTHWQNEKTGFFVGAAMAFEILREAGIKNVCLHTSSRSLIYTVESNSNRKFPEVLFNTFENYLSTLLKSMTGLVVSTFQESLFSAKQGAAASLAYKANHRNC
ncbi:Hypothetical predicted protein [Cloeon dipterum]|uniref:RNase H type-1 domain-containing protein n=1 Tax=Cloeon dipterum TaxID=197152 RepID=A0A8S1DW42_9INSE|nr:Hypothetical predicted protein [Cloeon dipterum]